MIAKKKNSTLYYKIHLKGTFSILSCAVWLWGQCYNHSNVFGQLAKYNNSVILLAVNFQCTLWYSVKSKDTKTGALRELLASKGKKGERTWNLFVNQLFKPAFSYTSYSLSYSLFSAQLWMCMRSPTVECFYVLGT